MNYKQPIISIIGLKFPERNRENLREILALSPNAAVLTDNGRRSEVIALNLAHQMFIDVNLPRHLSRLLPLPSCFFFRLKSLLGFWFFFFFFFLFSFRKWIERKIEFMSTDEMRSPNDPLSVLFLQRSFARDSVDVTQL